MKRLLDNLDKSYFPESRDFTVIFLILDTGMRLGECLSLTEDMVNITERTIQIPAGITKGRKNRTVFFSLKSVRMLQRWLRFKDDT